MRITANVLGKEAGSVVSFMTKNQHRAWAPDVAAAKWIKQYRLSKLDPHLHPSTERLQVMAEVLATAAQALLAGADKFNSL